ncbi:hypothetical protein BGP78_10350 [Pseudoalteromonas sp. MSK9-3]|uniref:TauD/TfdA family dioxygenase n=1 Tax=Pseudoalteromonas sp. MSK9-3 TaxID=1897633 RepID=UPI000E6B9260|nr:TauD/TfdA family dioxygenase [Pseudoalteromonas sp. MSK9-3]RJE76803.1 hypothetical protein BGP78_10350 [Pseudoalteromonas sp. MSK9-3]
MIEFDLSNFRLDGDKQNEIDPREDPHINGPLFADSHFLSEELTLGIESAIQSREPVIVLKEAFETKKYPLTPTEFQTSDEKYWWSAANTANGLASKFGLKLCSYYSENDGELFVNLVTNPSNKKSQSSMRGHTDAVAHHMPQEIKFLNESPSPDYVMLIVLRNPNKVPTVVASLSDILENISISAMDQLALPQFIIHPQATFNIDRILHNVPILFLQPLSIRYSHGKVSYDLEGANIDKVKRAISELNEAIITSSSEVFGNPGDIILVNNRTAIHGRKTPGPDSAGDSRWLMRTYAIFEGQRTSHKEGVPYKLKP